MPYLNETGVDALWKKVKGIAGNKLTAASADTSYTVGLQDKDGNSLSTATIAAASTTAAGVMTKADKSKLNGIATGATKVTVDSSPDNTSNNPLSNKAIQAQYDDLKDQIQDAASTKQNKLTAGDNIVISDKNVISATNTEYELPVATTSTLGGIKVGSSLAISTDGILDVTSEEKAVYIECDATSASFSSDHPSFSFCQKDQVGETTWFRLFFDEAHFGLEWNTNIAGVYQGYLKLLSSGFLDKWYAGNPDLSDVSQRIATTKFVADSIAAAQTGAAMFQGTAADAATILDSTYKQGYYWVASGAFTLGTETLEAGDMIFATKDKRTTSDTSDFSVVQANITAISTSYIDALN